MQHFDFYITYTELNLYKFHRLDPQLWVCENYYICQIYNHKLAILVDKIPQQT